MKFVKTSLRLLIKFGLVIIISLSHFHFQAYAGDLFSDSTESSQKSSRCVDSVDSPSFMDDSRNDRTERLLSKRNISISLALVAITSLSFLIGDKLAEYLEPEIEIELTQMSEASAGNNSINLKLAVSKKAPPPVKEVKPTESAAPTEEQSEPEKKVVEPQEKAEPKKTVEPQKVVEAEKIVETPKAVEEKSAPEPEVVKPVSVDPPEQPVKPPVKEVEKREIITTENSTLHAPVQEPIPVRAEPVKAKAAVNKKPKPIPVSQPIKPEIKSDPVPVSAKAPLKKEIKKPIKKEEKKPEKKPKKRPLKKTKKVEPPQKDVSSPAAVSRPAQKSSKTEPSEVDVNQALALVDSVATTIKKGLKNHFRYPSLPDKWGYDAVVTLDFTIDAEGYIVESSIQTNVSGVRQVPWADKTFATDYHRNTATARFALQAKRSLISASRGVIVTRDESKFMRNSLGLSFNKTYAIRLTYKHEQR